MFSRIAMYFYWISLFNGISTFISYLIPKPCLLKDNSDTI